MKTTITSAVALVFMHAAAPAQDIRIGALYPLSGSLALLGEESTAVGKLSKKELVAEVRREAKPGTD